MRRPSTEATPEGANDDERGPVGRRASAEQGSAHPGDPPSPLRAELGTLVGLSAPVALTQIGIMLTGVVDTLMVARLSPEALGASALGNMWMWSFLCIGMGLVMGIDPLVAQAHGRGDGAGTALALQRGIVVGLLASAPIAAAMALTEPCLVLLGQAPDVAAMAGRYNLLKLPVVPAFLVYSALRQYLQGRTLMTPATWVMWIGNVINAALNGVLIFGLLGFPALGLDGAAIASTLTILFVLAGLWSWVRYFRLSEGAQRRWDRQSFEARGLVQVARLGLPVGMQMTFEAWAFTWATLMAGWIDVESLGAHQIVLNLASLTFMIPLGVSQGAATRVGNLIGAGDAAGMRRAALLSLALGAGVMTISALAFTLLRHELPRLYTDNAATVAGAASILPMAAAFQLADGAQVVSAGLLRGMGRPDAAAAVNLVGYYAIALPLAYVVGFPLGHGLVGIWSAMSLGVMLVALALAVWVRRTAALPLEALQVAVRRA